MSLFFFSQIYGLLYEDGLLKWLPPALIVKSSSMDKVSGKLT